MLLLQSDSGEFYCNFSGILTLFQRVNQILGLFHFSQLISLNGHQFFKIILLNGLNVICKSGTDFTFERLAQKM